MSKNLLKAFSSADFEIMGMKSVDLVELSFKENKVSGMKFVRAVFADGTFMVKKMAEGETLMCFRHLDSIVKRNEMIEQLYEIYTQMDIAAILDISQATVSAVIHNSKRKDN